MTDRAATVGLCATCAHSRVIENRRGSRFWLCRLAESDASFPRYPPLPVLACRGYARKPALGQGPPAAGQEDPLP